jgi:hypothetical protein
MEHTTTEGRKPQILQTRQPFSGFDYIDEHFPKCRPIRRMFSQARCLGMESVVVEEIDPSGLVADENAEIKVLYPEHVMDNLRRITFWSQPIGSLQDLSKIDPKACLGYAIVKQDSIPSRRWNWHVFEAVMPPTSYQYCYVPRWENYEFRCGNDVFKVGGVLYCQQNGLNKACAQVALRSVCSLHVNPSDVSFRRINEFARITGVFDPGQGLEVRQMCAVLDGFGIRFRHIDYDVVDKTEDPAMLAHQKFVYAGIESGAGALLGFKLVGPEATGHHIIPLFGHTFNRDTWVPNAESAYFHIGDETRYIPSESWVSTFLAHDDNFGSNYAIPRLYVTQDQAQYVCSLYPKFFRYGGVEAEALAVNMLYSVRKKMIPKDLPWHRRALEAIDEQKVVLRPIGLSKGEYLDHLRQVEDWQGHKEADNICDGWAKLLPDHLWLVELSVPELFPANLRKFGEILLNASIELDPADEARPFIFVRLPATYIAQERTPTNESTFRVGESAIQSHTPLYWTASRQLG